MAIKRDKYKSAFTIIEVMAAILIMTIAVLGASSYRYYSALDARKAAMQSTAARIGLLLTENWRGLGGDETYDPTAYFSADLTITTMTDPSGLEYQFKETDFNMLGGYQVVVNSVNYYAVLSWKDVSSELRALNVVVAWSLAGKTESVDLDQYSYKESFKLTTYTSN
jgi:prepilin-type N-terminal cleavage/methylation domain-containing protein